LDLWRRDAIVRTAADPNRHIDKLLRGMKFVITQAQAVIVQPGKENPRMFTVAVFGSSGPSSALSFAPSESPANATSPLAQARSSPASYVAPVSGPKISMCLENHDHCHCELAFFYRSANADRNSASQANDPMRPPACQRRTAQAQRLKQNQCAESSI
jgi:hypothetical protein